MKTKLNIPNANIWLFIELIIITVVAWVVFDPAVVNLYYRSLPLGYDASRLIYGEYVTTGNEEDEYIREYGFMAYLERYEKAEMRQNWKIRQLMDVEGIESATFYSSEYSSIGGLYPNDNRCANEGDTISLSTIPFNPNTLFFETYGLRPLPGSPSAEELSHITVPENKVVLTRSGAITVFGTDDVVGRQFKVRRDTYRGEEVIYDEVTVAGVVEDFRKSVSTTLHSIYLRPDTLDESYFVLRLREGIDAHRFLEEHGKELIRKGKTKFSRISRIMTFQEHLQQQELDAGRTQEMNRSLALAFFFLVNLCLAVIGTVWLHAKRRTEECGVRRAFGATRLRLLLEMLWQNAILATIAIIVGLVVFLNYAHSGIHNWRSYTPSEAFYSLQTYWWLDFDKTWPDYFWPHFFIVSACVYIIIMCTVFIGTAIPAIKIIRTNITDAIREE